MFDQDILLCNFFVMYLYVYPTLSEVEKFYYLKAALQGEALALIQSLPSTKENYNEALNLLKKSVSE